ncbi:MAG TPA: SDR family oxidoreductase [Bryobacteraceae bacterium]|nr:SDR family oxidoreductase [Bryobacteraceae bacterium]
MKPRLKPLSEQVVVLIGASGGIGRQTALDFAGRGARVVAAARDQEGLQSLAETITARGGTVEIVVADAADFDAMRKVADTAAARFGRIDTWVHLAGISIYARFEETTPEEWKRIIEVNLNGQAFGAMAALPHLRRTGGGALIHISSVEARRALPYQSAYAASKHGITGMLEALRLELQHEGVPISVTEILPSSIDTQFFDKARTRIGVKPQGLPPLYEPKAVSDAILHAAEHPVREFVVGGAGKLLQWTQELAPGIADKVLLKIAFQGQKTRERKSEGAPNNLFHPMPQYSGVEGSGQGHPAAWNWVEKHPFASRLVLLSAVTAAFTLWLRESPPRRA